MKSPQFSVTLRQAGLRATGKRQAVLQQLEKSQRPLSVEDIRLQNPRIDPVTIYRMLDQLTEARLVQTITWRDGIRRYESSNQPHHHHLVCDHCGRVEDFIITPDRSFIASVTKRHRFKAHDHSIEIYGLCVNCQ